MTWIKICGTTNLDDALMAVDAGADALGFVFYEKSPRNIAPETAREIVSKLPREVEKVGVLPNASLTQCREWAEKCGLTAMQMYFAPYSINEGNRAVGFGSTTKIYLTLSVSEVMGDNPKFDISGFAKMPSDPNNRNPFSAIVLDSGSPQNPGGTGKIFDWKAAAPLVASLRGGVKVVVAGGLNPENVADAIRILDPWGVDVVSGVESRAGKKDRHKLQAFIRAVRRSETRTE